MLTSPNRGKGNDKDKEEVTKMARKHGRANGQGTLEKRGNIYRARWMVDGKVYTRSTGCSDKRDAEKRLADFIAPFQLGNERATLEGLIAKVKGVEGEIQRHEESQPALSIADTFAAYRACLSRPNRAGGDTLDRYESQFGEFAEWLAKHHPEVTELRHVSKQVAEEFATALAAKSSAGTFNKRITLFRAMWEHLADTARLTVNPWKLIRKHEGMMHTRRELTVEELGRVCSSLKGEMRLLFAIGIYTGLRLGDCCRLDWGNIDLARRMISIIPHKTMKHSHGKPVLIPLHPTLAGMLAEIPQEERTGYLMPKIANAFARDPASVSKKIQAVFEANGIQTKSAETSESGRAKLDVGFHSLRHTFVSLAANAGVPLALVQAIVGHSNPAMTRHYFHESLSSLREAVAALPALGDSAQEKPTVALPKAALALLDKLDRSKLLALRSEIDKRL